MSDEINHYCGIAMVRLLKPIEFFINKYHSIFYGLNLLYPLMEKQRNRGQDGAGIASIKLDMDPGHRYLDMQRSVHKDPISDVIELCKEEAKKGLSELPKGFEENSRLLKHQVPFTGELFLGHVRYGTDSENCHTKCHPVPNVNNWPTRSLVLAGNFNLTNLDELFSELISYGQHPREKSDTVTLIEDLSYLLDVENQELYSKFYSQGYDVPTCFQKIAENLNMFRILRHAAKRWDGGYCLGGMLGHGDMFALRDPNGIRPCYYYISDEICIVASERPVIQSVLKADTCEVKELQPGHALLVKRDGTIAIERVTSVAPELKCSFERIYFSRGGDSEIYKERLRLGEMLSQPVLETCDYDMSNMIISFVPNTSEICYYGLLNGLNTKMCEILDQGWDNKKLPSDQIMSSQVRTGKVLTKDAKIRTFIQEDNSRDNLISLAYDITYDCVGANDILVMVDDSIVRGATMKNSILFNLQRLKPKKVVIVSSAPQIRYPDCYGIDISKFNDLVAFQAAISLLKERGMQHILDDVYNLCKRQIKYKCRSNTTELTHNYVKKLYEPFTVTEITQRIVQLIRPENYTIPVNLVYQTVEGLHQAIPNHRGDWYFTGNYPTPGGYKSCSRSYINWYEGHYNERGYGLGKRINMNSVLILGNKEIEVFLAQKISQSERICTVWLYPNNPHTELNQYSGKLIKAAHFNKDGSLPTHKEILHFCKLNCINYVILNHFELNHTDIIQLLSEANIPVFGPSFELISTISDPNFMKEINDIYGHEISQRYSCKDIPETLSIITNHLPKMSPHSFVSFENKGQKLPTNLHFNNIHDYEEFMENTNEISKPYNLTLDNPILEGSEIAYSVICDKKGQRFFLPPIGIIRKVMYNQAYIHDYITFTYDIERMNSPNQQQNYIGATIGPVSFPGENDLLQIEEILINISKYISSLGYEEFYCLTGYFLLSQNTVLTRVSCDLSNPHLISAFTLIKNDIDILLFSGYLKEMEAKTHNFSCISIHPKCNIHSNTDNFITGIHHAMALSNLSTYISQISTSWSNIELENHLRRNKLFKIEGNDVLTLTSTGNTTQNAFSRLALAMKNIRYIGRDYITSLSCPNLSHTNPREYLLSYTDLRRLDFLSLKTNQEDLENYKLTPKFPPSNGIHFGNNSYDSNILEDDYHYTLTQLFNDKKLLVLSDKGAKYSIPNIFGGSDNEELFISMSDIGFKSILANNPQTYYNLGYDLVARTINTMIASYGIPTLFLDYLISPNIEQDLSMDISNGILDACEEAECKFLIGEKSKYDKLTLYENINIGISMSGICIGKPVKLLHRSCSEEISEGDILLGITSETIHPTGISIILNQLDQLGLKLDDPTPWDPCQKFRDVLMRPCKIYVSLIRELTEKGYIKRSAYVDHKGIYAALKKIIPTRLYAKISSDHWDMPQIYHWLLNQKQINNQTLYNTFNCGIGMLIIIDSNNLPDVMDCLKYQSKTFFQLSKLTNNINNEPIPFELNLKEDRLFSNRLLRDEMSKYSASMDSLADAALYPFQFQRKAKVALLVTENNEEALIGLIQSSKDTHYPASIEVIIYVLPNESISPMTQEVLADSQIPIEYIFQVTSEESEFESNRLDLLNEPLFKYKIDLICNISYKVDLPEAFIQLWRGKLLALSLEPLNESKQTTTEDLILQGTPNLGCWIYLLDNISRPYEVIKKLFKINELDTLKAAREKFKNECIKTAYVKALKMVSEGIVELTDEGISFFER